MSKPGVIAWMNSFKWSLITVEPALFLLNLGKGLSGPTDQAILYRKVCLNMYNDSICDDLTAENSSSYQNAVQKETSQWQFYENLCYNIPALLTVFLYGSWSDRFSRKFPLFLCPIGSFLLTLNYLINAVFISAPVGFILLGNLVYGFSGGFTTFLMAAFSYLSVSAKDKKKRTARISMVYAFDSLASALSMFVSGVILDHTGFVFVYSLVLVIYCAVIIYISLRLGHLKEPPTNQEERVSLSELRCAKKCTSVFGIDHLKTAVLVTFKKRPGVLRQCVLTIICALFFYMISSSHHISYLFFRHYPLNWDQTLYGYYSGYHRLVSFTSYLLLLPFLKSTFNASDQLLLIIGFSSEMASRLWTGFCTKTWMVFLVPVFGYMGSFSIACIRGLVSSMVETDEYGKIFAVVGWLESLGSLLSSYLFSDFLYPLTVDVYAGFCFFISGLLTLIPVLLAVWLYFVLRKHPLNYTELRINDEVTTAQQANDLIVDIQEAKLELDVIE